MILVDERAGDQRGRPHARLRRAVRSAAQWLPIFELRRRLRTHLRHPRGVQRCRGQRQPAVVAALVGRRAARWRAARTVVPRSAHESGRGACGVNRRVNPHFEVPGSPPASPRRGRSRDRELAPGRRQRAVASVDFGDDLLGPSHGRGPARHVRHANRSVVPAERDPHEDRMGARHVRSAATPVDSRPTRAATSASAAPPSSRFADSSRDRMPCCPRPSRPCSAAPTRCAAIAPVTGRRQPRRGLGRSAAAAHVTAELRALWREGLRGCGNGVGRGLEARRSTLRTRDRRRHLPRRYGIHAGSRRGVAGGRNATRALWTWCEFLSQRPRSSLASFAALSAAVCA